MLAVKYEPTVYLCDPQTLQWRGCVRCQTQYSVQLPRRFSSHSLSTEIGSLPSD